jgi:putative spermidine/putrescine transport system substrate-binding protein
MKLKLGFPLLIALFTFAVVPNAFAADPPKALDFSKLTRATFYEKIVPVAKSQGSLVFFDFSSSLEPIFKDVIIPNFQAKYGIKVNYYKVNGDTAVQQVLAATGAGQAAPVDAFFIGSGAAYLTLMKGKGIANIPLNKIMPNAANIRPDTAESVSGVSNGGAYVPFHLNQTAIAYDSTKVSAADLPKDFNGFLAFAKAHPRQVAVTAPTRGGSGEGFAAAVTYSLFTDAERKKLYDFSLTVDEAYAWLKTAPSMPKVLDYYRSLKPVVEFTNGNADTLNLIANGAVVMGSAWEDMTFTYLNQGLLPKTTRLTILSPVMYGGFDGICVPATSARKEAAALFIDEAMSLNSQIQKAVIIGSRTARTDIGFGNVLSEEKKAYLLPDADFNKYSTTWYSKNFTAAINKYITEQVLAQ